MQCKRLVPLIAVDDLGASVRFFVERFGFEIVFLSDGLVSLRHPDGDLQLGFVRPLDDEVAYGGRGLTYGLEVDDVDHEYRRLTHAGVDTDGPPRDNPWGDRSFTVVDPNGIALHIHHPIEPSPEYRSYFPHASC